MQVEAIQLPSGLGASLGAASTPEDAAKIFMNAATNRHRDTLFGSLRQTVGVWLHEPFAGRMSSCFSYCL